MGLLLGRAVGPLRRWPGQSFEAQAVRVQEADALDKTMVRHADDVYIGGKQSLAGCGDLLLVQLLAKWITPAGVFGDGTAAVSSRRSKNAMFEPTAMRKERGTYGESSAVLGTRSARIMGASGRPGSSS
jgi:hypothetical protein